MDEIVFSQVDFGLLEPLLADEDVTDISYSNNGQLWVKTLTQGVQPRHIEGLNNEAIEKLAFQCSNVMGKTFNMAHPFLDAESAELRLNFVHDSIATNGVALLIRKTPAMIRLNKDKLVNEDYNGSRFYIIDDICATGNTLEAIKHALEDLGGIVVGEGVVMNIVELNNNKEMFSLIDVNEE